MAGKAKSQEPAEITRGKLIIASEKHFGHSRLIMSRARDLEALLRRSLQSTIEFHKTERNETRRNRRTGESSVRTRSGVSADQLNAALRRKLGTSRKLRLRFECDLVDGYFRRVNGNRGFDFGLIDEEWNTTVFRNRCLGRLSYVDGQAKWNSREARAELGIRALPSGHRARSVPRGESAAEDRTGVNILGEIQFGNHGLLWKDLFRALAAVSAGALDALVYVTATGRLNRELSGNIVSYAQAERALTDHARDFRFPVWLIGLDVGPFSQ